MKKIKILTSLVGLTGLSMGLVPTIVGCSCSEQSVILDEAVTKKGVTIKSSNIVQGKDSTIELNLPGQKTISAITLQVGSNTLYKSDVRIISNKITIPAAKMTANKVSIKSITLADPVTVVDFLTCSWDEISTWCTKLENGDIDTTAFCTHFLNGTAKIADMDGFVGLEREIQINGQTHVVRVIGAQHKEDLIVENEQVTTKVAALTFEMVTLLSDSNGDKMTSKWHSDNKNYTNSILRANLTDEGEGTKSFANTALSMLPNELQPCIKTVQKSVREKGPITTYFDKLFPLTSAEMALDPTFVTQVGSAYTYWTKNESKSYTEAIAGRIKKDANGSSSYYWLDSRADDVNDEVCVIMNNGELDFNSVSDSIGVSFAFCI